MAVRGKLAVDIQFADTTAVGVVSSVKTLSLQDASEYTTGRVLTVTGTAGTSAVTIPVNPSVYKDSNGNVVSLASIDWLAFRSSAGAECSVVSGNGSCVSIGNQVAISSASGGTSGLTVSTFAGTAQFTLVVYGT